LYKQNLAKLSPSIDLSNLNTNQITVYGEQVSWEKSNFEKLPLPLVIFNIIRIELAIQSAETAVMHHLQ
jgi:hypothetical protein